MIIWGNTISTNTSRPDYAETKEELASFIKNKPDAAIKKAQDTADQANTAAGKAQTAAEKAQTTADSKVAQITAEVVLTASGWSGERQTVAVEGVTTINTVFIAPVPASIEPFGYYEITCVKQGNGNLTFQCDGDPDVDITLNVVILDVTVAPGSGGAVVPGENGGYYIPVVTQTGTNTVTFQFNPSETDTPKVDPVSVTLPAGTGSGGTADPAGTAANAVSGHNSAADAHADIRLQLTAINDRLKAFFDSDDQTLDELREIVAYITSNKSLIDAITTSKVSVLDIVNNLVTNVPAKPLSAAQGVVLKSQIDDLRTGKLDAAKLTEAINTALAQAKASGEFDGKVGYAPVRGIDYWTEADQEAIVRQTIQKIGIETVPDYVVTEAMSVLDKVVSAQGSRTFVLGAITDMHYGSSDYIDGVIHACQGMHHIAKRIKLDALAVLGDYTDEHQMDTETALTDNEEMNALLDMFCSIVNLRLKGNHDHRPGADAQTYRYIMSYSDDVVWGSRIGGYFYRDFQAYKLRIICLNTTEVARDNVSVSDEQYNFFVNALDMSAKEDSAEWGILILSHHPLDWTVTSGAYRFGRILNAYQNGNSWTDGTVSCNYADKNSAIIVGNIHGHIHNLLTDKIYVGEPGNSAQTSVWRMCVPASRVDYPNHYSGIWIEDTTYNKTPNGAKDTAFNIICIDLDSYTIKAFCYGAGYDRTLEYKSAPDDPGGGGISDDKNWIKKSTESDGVTPYNGGQGYKTGTRYSVSSSAETTSSGCVSGYIPVETGDVFYLKNVSLNANNKTNENNIVFITQSGGWNHIVSALQEYNDAVLDSDGNVTQFGVYDTSVKWIRINASYIGADSIVTKNEPIV